MKKYTLILMKELKEDRNWIFAIAGFLFIFGLYGFFKAQKWRDLSITFSTFPLILMSVLPFFWGYFRTMKKENDTKFYILSLPISKPSIILSKITSLTIEMFLFVFIILLWVFLISLRMHSKVPIHVFFKMFIFESMRLSGLGIFTLSIYLYSRCFNKARGWLAFLFLVILLYLYLDFFAPNLKFFDSIQNSLSQYFFSNRTVSFNIKFFIYSILNVTLSIFLFTKFGKPES